MADVEGTITTTFVLHPVYPFHFGATVRKPSNFDSRCTDHAPGQYWQTMRWNGRIVGIRMTDIGEPAAPEVEVTIFSDEPLEPGYVSTLGTELRWRFDLDADLGEFYSRFADDPVLGGPLRRWAGMRMSSPYSLYEFLVVTVLLQNTTVRRTIAMQQALFETYGRRVRFDGRELFAFWQPSALSEAGEPDLRALKVGYRAKALTRISEVFARHEVDEYSIRGMSQDSARATLLKLYGVGPASVWYLLFSLFHYYDAFDVISPWEQRIYSRLLFDDELVPAEKILQEVRHRWGQWRMLASTYVFEDLFWRHADSPIPWLADLIRT
jgi:3-methyladenine DNA glycosylase/8-oxoguanine DNA glycosylase